MFTALHKFIKSFYSPIFYDEVANENDRFVFSYLVAINFCWSLVGIIIFVLLTILAGGAALFLIPKFLNLPTSSYISGYGLLIGQVILNVIIMLEKHSS